MSSREAILASIRKNQPENVELPSLEGDWIEFDDPVGKFSETLAGVGGQCVALSSYAELNEHLKSQDVYTQAKVTCSQIAGVGEPNLDLASIADPHDLEAIDFAILPADFAVAENGAVWVPSHAAPHRVATFITQHLAFVVPASELVHNMHQAYRRLEFKQPGFGLFVSGPSKTADIEQSLVIGAHGARSLTVYLIDRPE